MPRKDDDMPEVCVRHDEALQRIESDQNAANAANAADHREIMDKLDSMDEAIRGNGSPGIRTQISRLKLQVGVMWGLFIAGITAAVVFVVRHFLEEKA